MDDPNPNPTPTAAPADAQPAASASAVDLRAALAGLSIDEMRTTAASVTPSPGDRTPGAGASPEKAADGKEAETEATPKEQTGQQQRGEDGKFVSKEKEAGKVAEKDDQRAAKTWEEINAEKAKLEAERVELERQRREFDAKAATIKDAASKAKASADDLERFAKEWESEGRDDLAQAARAQASKLQREAQEVDQQAKVAEFRRTQDGVIRQLVKDNPELADRGSELYRATDSVLKRIPELLTKPDGLRYAVEYAKAHSAAGRTQALEKELAETKQRLAEREKLLQPATGGPSAPSGEVPFDQLPSAERSKRLKAALRATDTRSLAFA